MKFLHAALVVLCLSLPSLSVAGDITPLQKSPAQKTATQKAEPAQKSAVQKGDAEAEHLGFWARRRVRISSRRSVGAILLVGSTCSNCR